MARPIDLVGLADKASACPAQPDIGCSSRIIWVCGRCPPVRLAAAGRRRGPAAVLA
jgi:hypothetical protein